MAVFRIKLFWGATDIQYSDEASYTPQEVKNGGPSALEGIGVRRCLCVFSRTVLGSIEDQMVTHFDCLNLTSGEPDDSWEEQDFLNAEGAIHSFWSSLAPRYSTHIMFDQMRWYKIGPGILPPNPAVRITDANVTGTATDSLPPQVAVTLTQKTIPRRQWGRQYMPLNATTNMDVDGRLSTTLTAAIADVAGILANALSDFDLPLVVYSPTRQKAYTVESIQVDNLYDVMRSRRYDHPTIREQRAIA